MVYSSSSRLATEAAIWSSAVCPSFVIIRPPFSFFATYLRPCIIMVVVGGAAGGRRSGEMVRAR